MPIYEYQCETCKGEIEEVITRDRSHEICKICGTKMRKLFPTKTTFRLKGGGWYENDKTSEG